MASSARYRRQSTSGSPPLSTTAYSTSYATTVGQQKLNVVTRLAIEGRAERGANGAAIKIYLKISLPLDSITPGSTLPLFPEENLKILDSQVHPLDAHSTPYNFSSVTSPLLHKAARALNLPARLPQSYIPLSASAASSDALPPLDEKYTGQILVSSYHVSYILPKEFPRRESNSRSKRPTTVAQFMAAIDVWVPFLTQPPHAPFLLSIPVPRCLSNQIRLKIFPPNNPKTSSSLASLSSADEDAGGWDMTSDPHVTRSASGRLTRSHSYNNFADDESSDASTSAGFSDGCGIKGSFPSSERIRIRWARPMKPEQLPQTVDGRRRVGIREVKGNMACAILGASQDRDYGTAEGIVMRVQYEATCKGVWFPGVATLLGLDVGLDAGDCDVSWVSGLERKWSISGDAGFTGFAVGPPPTPPLSRQSSVDNPSIYVLPSSPDARGHTNGLPPARHDSSSSTSSLLRAPLPAQSVPDYSFESSPTSTPISSLASLPIPSSPEHDRRSRASSLNGRYTDVDTDYEDDDDTSRPPKVPITIHLNMNDLLPPAKHDFKFRISGTILVTPRKPVLSRSSGRYRSSPNGSRPASDNETDPDVLVIPRFRVICTDREYISCTIQNEVNDATVDVYNSVGDVRDAQTRKTVLQKGGQVKCGTDGARVALRPLKRSPSPPARGRRDDDSLDVSRISRSRPRTPNGASRRDISPSVLRQSFFASTLRTPIRRDGPLVIPSVKITVTPFPQPGMCGPPEYAVRVNLPAPLDADMEWLEFGLALPNIQQGTAPPSEAPKVEIAGASIEGVPVRFVTSAVVKPETNGAVPFGEASGKDWITWVKVHLGDAGGGGKVEIIYLVKGQQVRTVEKPQDKQTALEPITLNALLPSFSLPVSALKVNVRVKTGFEIASVKTNLSHEQSVPYGHQFLHYALEEYFYPRLIVELVSSARHDAHTAAHTAHPPPSWSWAQIFATLIPIIIMILLLLDRARLLAPAETPQLARSPGEDQLPPHVYQERVTETITVTATATLQQGASSSPRWYSPDTDATAAAILSPAAQDPAATASPVPAPPPRPSSIASIPTATPTPIVSEEPLSDLWEYFSNAWYLHIEMPTIEFPEIHILEAANGTLHKVIDSLDSVYQLVRKVANWPMDPS
ncbi:hypothetical protein BD413DRAFT_607898 [Trametes elegans]|nr:hypothetical protein BD413DRAFT_607898 [Trametes elegans]